MFDEWFHITIPGYLLASYEHTYIITQNRKCRRSLSDKVRSIFRIIWEQYFFLDIVEAGSGGSGGSGVVGGGGDGGGGGGDAPKFPTL